MNYNKVEIIDGVNVGDLWIQYLSEVFYNGHEYYDDNEKIIERENLVLKIKENDPKDKILKKYADKKIIDLYLKKMQTTEIVEELNASYGKRLFDQLGVNQYEWVLNRLRNKAESKAATISFLLPNDPGPRIPCLDILDYKLRDNILYTKVFFRSQNVLRAYGNFNSIFWLSDKLASDLTVKRGFVTIFVSNAHFLKSNKQIVKNIIEDYNNESIEK
ncbi:MAG: hypothetical protein ACOCP8_06800 [archaeon]